MNEYCTKGIPKNQAILRQITANMGPNMISLSGGKVTFG